MKSKILMAKICSILILTALMLNSSLMLIVSEAVEAIQTSTDKEKETVKTQAVGELELTKYENFNTMNTESSSDTTGSKGVLVQYSLKTGITFDENAEYTPIKKTSINIDLPWIGDYKPERVEVITKSTKATNGGKDAKYEYNSNTGILQITAENNDYTENVSEARDEYEIICIYKSECYTKDEKRLEACIMADISSALRSTIPISLFNRGMAGKVFEDVRRQGAKVVMKNNSPECVLLSPEEYLRLIDEVNDAKLAALAAQRMQGFDPANAIPAEEVYRQNGITKAALDSMDEVEFE